MSSEVSDTHVLDNTKELFQSNLLQHNEQYDQLIKALINVLI
jgi:hypothetical protein